MIFAFLVCASVVFFLGTLEAALRAMDRLRLRLAARRNGAQAVTLAQVLTRPDLVLGAISGLRLALKLLVLLSLLTWLQRSLNFPATMLLLVLALPALVLLLDFLPQALGRRYPDRIWRWFGWVLCCSPAVWWPLLRRKPQPRPQLGVGLSLGDLRQATNQAVESGALQPLQKHFLHSLLNAHAVPVRELAAALSAVPSLPGSTRVEEVLELSRQTGQTRWLVRAEGGGVLGQLRTFDLLLDDTRQGSAQSFVRRIPELPEDEPLLRALCTMRAGRANVALVSSPGAAPRVVSAESLVRRILLGASQVPPTEPPAGRF